MIDDHIHSKLVSPYLTQLSENMKIRFSRKVMSTCITASLFEPKKVSDSKSYASELPTLSSLHHSLCLSDLRDE